MTGYLTDYTGQRFKLPLFLNWEITHTDGSDGTDSFEVTVPYDKAMKEPLENAVYFRLEHEGSTVFYGVTDEYEVSVSQKGMTAKIAGRGMGARLLDNRCIAAEYISCTLSDMVRKYVTPYGVEVGKADAFPPMYGYSVSTNESCLSALSGYTRFTLGITPRFSKEGKLMLTKSAGEKFKLDIGEASEFTLFSRRYGVLSEVSVVTVDGVKQKVSNEEFAKKGGRACAVVSVPRNTSWDMVRYTGSYQLEKSKAGRYSIELTVGDLFPCFPADVCVISSEFCESGEYKVTETCCFGDETGCGTTIKLTKEGF